LGKDGSILWKQIFFPLCGFKIGNKGYENIIDGDTKVLREKPFKTREKP